MRPSLTAKASGRELAKSSGRIVPPVTIISATTVCATDVAASRMRILMNRKHIACEDSMVVRQFDEWRSGCRKRTYCRTLNPVKYFDWNDAKNAQLQEERGLEFERYRFEGPSAEHSGSPAKTWRRSNGEPWRMGCPIGR